MQGAVIQHSLSSESDISVILNNAILSISLYEKAIRYLSVSLDEDDETDKTISNAISNIESCVSIIEKHKKEFSRRDLSEL